MRSEKNKNLKMLLIIALFFIYSAILNYAAIISDNDGSAFVTKAEFEGLKKSFDEQINNYNLSIDRKIDGSIASYIAGLNLRKKQKRTKLIKAATSWCMYSTDDYPKYVEGYPYITGFTMYGNLRTSEPYGSTWAGVTFNGDPQYRTNGGFKKHIVGKPSKNVSKNGNENYVAEWQGYYKDEGELLTFAGFKSEDNGGWAANDEDTIQWRDVVSFENDVCPLEVAKFWITNTAHGTSTPLSLYCSSAQRIIGKMDGDTNVSIYKNISDNRFWDSTMSNRVGITSTTPSIIYRKTGSAMSSWLAAVMPSANVKLTCHTKFYNSSTGRYTIYYKTNWSTSDLYSYENFQKDYTVTNYAALNNNYYMFKLANDHNDLQFVRLWSGITDSVAQNLNTMMEDSKTSASDRNQIKAALLFDENDVPHLSMGAGYPFLGVSYDEKVEFNFKINGSGNYKVYAKYGPFSPTGDASSEADVQFNVKSGSTTTKTTVLNVTGGTNTKMEFDVTKDGTSYIFLKWCDTTTNNGGTMDLSNDPIITPAL